MKKLLMAVIILSIFSGMAAAQEKTGNRKRIDRELLTISAFALGLQMLPEVNKAIIQKIKEKKEAAVSQADIDTLAQDNPEFVEIESLYTDIKESWPAVREKIANQKEGEESFIFQHFTGTMDKYMALAGLVKKFSPEETAAEENAPVSRRSVADSNGAPTGNTEKNSLVSSRLVVVTTSRPIETDPLLIKKGLAVDYLKKLAKLIDEPFEVKWSKEPFITSQFIDMKQGIFSLSLNYMDQLDDFASALRKYKKFSLRTK
ncbi:MAG: hypothetical protein LBL61_03360 [Elusimicrobiota bacterium]|jgi:hypothetical protein|nr:hypothetical protein [Elusimicrobiota bacterium]